MRRNQIDVLTLEQVSRLGLVVDHHGQRGQSDHVSRGSQGLTCPEHPPSCWRTKGYRKAENHSTRHSLRLFL